MADRLADGQLQALMDQYYAESHSWEDVSRRLFADHGIQLSGQTLRRWSRLPGTEAVA